MSDKNLEVESDLGRAFFNHTVQRLTQENVSEETRSDIAEYIVVLISNNRSPLEIIGELSSISGEEISKEFIESLFRDLDNLRSSSGSASNQAPPVTSSIPPSAFSSGATPYSRPERPKHPRLFNSGGVRKQPGAFRKNLVPGMANPAQLQKALTDLLDGNKKKGRCKNFPHCSFKNCQFAHPTKTCYQYPNCPNAPGTCNFLHPGEDDELIAELAKTKAEYEQKKINNQQQLEQQNGIGICHKGANCFLATCRYAHPPKANDNASITMFEWCPAGKDCADPGCGKCHPSHKTMEEVVQSGGYKPSQGKQQGFNNKFAKIASALQQQEEKSLEQCKFGARCLNPRCKFRHASSPVLCRDGENCDRIDCYFSHPLSQDCKYSINCKNKYCLFKHPAERALLINKPLVWTASGEAPAPATSERQFAVSGEEIDKVPPQEDASMAV